MDEHDVQSEGGVRAFAQGILNVRYLLMVALVGMILLHIEVGLALRYAPETVLIQVTDTKGAPEEDTQCFADIIAGPSVVKKKPLRALESVYEVISSQAFFANTDRGFHILETGLPPYQQSFEIRIVCYTSNFESVSYTLINEHNQAECSVQDGGRVLVC